MARKNRKKRTWKDLANEIEIYIAFRKAIEIEGVIMKRYSENPNASHLSPEYNPRWKNNI